jgi:hypothetical protein
MSVIPETVCAVFDIYVFIYILFPKISKYENLMYLCINSNIRGFFYIYDPIYTTGWDLCPYVLTAYYPQGKPSII